MLPHEENIAPTVREVAALLESRTRNSRSGMLEKTFNEETRPTAEQVLELIEDAVEEVRTDLGTESVPEPVKGQVRSLIALVTAMKIEESFYTEQMESSKSPYKVFQGQYERRLDRVIKSIERALEGNSEMTETDTLPHFSFPDGSNPQAMIGWGTNLGG